MEEILIANRQERNQGNKGQISSLSKTSQNRAIKQQIPLNLIPTQDQFNNSISPSKQNNYLIKSPFAQTRKKDSPQVQGDTRSFITSVINPPTGTTRDPRATFLTNAYIQQSKRFW